MLFKPNRTFTSFSPTVKIHDTELEFVDTFKFLGIHFNNKLTWQTHFNQLCSKLSRNIGVIDNIKDLVKMKTLTTLYYSLFYSYVSYAMLSGRTLSKLIYLH